MTSSQKIIYAQSSDIRSRSFLEYRRDMKKKGIAELEFLPYLQKVLSGRFHDSSLEVRKHGGDAQLWFGRSARQVTQQPDYLARLSDGEAHLYEFQYAEEIDRLAYIDFKLSKVSIKPRNQPRVPHRDREFFYVIKPENKYAFITPVWIMDNGSVGAVPAWGSRPAYRVPKDVFLEQCVNGGNDLETIICAVDDKNLLLDFQHRFLDIENQRFSRRLQRVIDEDAIIRIVPRTLDGFYRVCYLLDKIQKTPDAPGVWLIYLMSFYSDDMRSIDFARLMYSLDFLYFKCPDFKGNELRAIHSMLNDATAYIENRINNDGSLAKDPTEAPFEETRQMLFSINLLEDISQDSMVNFEVKLPPTEKVFQMIPDAGRTAEYIRNAENRS